MAPPLIVALLGAESTGKTTLAAGLCAALARDGCDVAMVPETLREFCDRHERTPRQDEQQAIALEQTRRIDAAAATHAVVIADTTALMTAVYSDWVFGDTSLYAMACDAQRRCTLNLLTALDLPWQADGLQRDGPHVREPVDRLIRAALQIGRLDYCVIGGIGEPRLASALAAVRHALGSPEATADASDYPRWRWLCERCSDADCERHPLAARDTGPGA